jgi:glycosyltransferase involved in cell wall biosynthesis
MRIAQISTSGTRVAPRGTGSIEGHVWLLSRELARRGHEVTVFATAGSQVEGARVVESLPGVYGEGGAPCDWRMCEWINVARAVQQASQFDVIHSHNYLWGIPLQELSTAPMLHTLHVAPGDDEACLMATYPKSRVVAISGWQWNEHPSVVPAAMIHHGVDPDEFQFSPESQDYVCYLGRFTPEKGPIRAIKSARALGMKVRLAGPADEYFNSAIAPLVDGKDVVHVGAVAGTKRSEFLRGAKALLYPLRSAEPFGLVMIEAMMCGTPVAAMRIGATPEVIDEGITGYLADTKEAFAETVKKCFQLDRRRVREQAEKRFSAQRMTSEYERVYERLVAERRRGS